MKTKVYNPSELEVNLLEIIEQLSPEIDKALNGNKITGIKTFKNEDNPYLLLTIEDEDKDIHEVVIKMIQKPDAH